jgi:hypothetical protein
MRRIYQLDIELVVLLLYSIYLPSFTSTEIAQRLNHILQPGFLKPEYKMHDMRGTYNLCDLGPDIVDSRDYPMQHW